MLAVDEAFESSSDNVIR